MKQNKALIILMVTLMVIVIALFSYFSTYEGDDGEVRTYSFPTSTPTNALVGNGWWNAMPTPISVETMRP
jgi:hypothetical protein